MSDLKQNIKDLDFLKEIHTNLIEREYEEARNKIYHWIDELIEKTKHTHVAGTTKGLDIDTCAECGRNLWHEAHIRKTQ